MDEQYLRTPFFGVRRLRAWLVRAGYKINRKRIKRLMDVWGWQTIYRRPRTTIPQPSALHLATIVGAVVKIQAPSEQLLPSGVPMIYLNKRLYLS